MKYKNRLVINQRGGSVVINNTTDNESVSISHRSGSNVTMNNVTNSELATNNKQQKVINDNFKSVGADDSEFVGRDKINRVVRNTFNYKGVNNESEIQKYEEWKETYREIANINGQFNTYRGGYSLPTGIPTPRIGSPKENQELLVPIYTVNSSLTKYGETPIRNSQVDEVVSYAPIPEQRNEIAESVLLEEVDLTESAGVLGSEAPGFMEFGPDTPNNEQWWVWEKNSEWMNLPEKIKELYKTETSDPSNPKLGPLAAIEKEMGDGGDEHIFIKRDKFETVGATINDYPSVRITPKGRGHPLEVIVSRKGSYNKTDYLPHVEEVDNSSMFPCGNDIKIVGNKYKRTVGSGGVDFKTTGTFEIGSGVFNLGATKVNINSSNGVQIGSEAGVDIHSLKTITLRTNRQVYVESSLGVKGNLITTGSAYFEGELYTQHITGPVEIQQTEDTTLYGKFNTTEPRTLLIGECIIGDFTYPVYAVPSDDLIKNYPHSHHFKNISMTLKSSNAGVRADAMKNDINKHGVSSQASGQIDCRKEIDYPDDEPISQDE